MGNDWRGGGPHFSACCCLANRGPPKLLSLYPTNSELERQHQSTTAKVQGCLSTKRDFSRTGPFAFQAPASSHRALHSIALHVKHNALSPPDFLIVARNQY